MLAAAFLSAAATAPAPAAYPVREVLAAFEVACARVENTAGNLADARAAGWERLAPDADTQVSRLVRQGKEVLAKHAPSARMLDGAEFRKPVAGRTLYLAVSGVKSEDGTSRGCRLYDFAANQGPAPKDLTAWAKREPDSTSQPSESLIKYTWKPGLRPAHTDMDIYFIAPGRNPLPGFDTSGLTLVASALE